MSVYYAGCFSLSAAEKVSVVTMLDSPALWGNGYFSVSVFGYLLSRSFLLEHTDFQVSCTESLRSAWVK